MASYRVGDLVLVKTEQVMSSWNPEMDEFLGNAVIIEDTDTLLNGKKIYFVRTKGGSQYHITNVQIEKRLEKDCKDCIIINFSKKLAGIFKKWNSEKFDKIRFRKSEDDFPFNYLDIAISDPTKISYLTKDRAKRFEDYNCDYFDSIKREKFAYMAKPGKILTKFASEDVEITKNDIEKLQALLFEARGCKLEIVRGEDIRKYYHYSAYCECGNSTGSLKESCMRYNSCQEFFDFYVDNVAMLILRCPKCKKIIGRAILWENLKIEDEKRKVIFMDRIYGNDQTIQLFKYHAFLNNWMHKKYQSYDENILKEYTETKEEKEDYYKFVFKTNKQYKYFPFMDTMAYLHYTKKGGLELRNYGKSCYSKYITCKDPEQLTNTEGNTYRIERIMPAEIVIKEKPGFYVNDMVDIIIRHNVNRIMNQ